VAALATGCSSSGNSGSSTTTSPDRATLYVCISAKAWSRDPTTFNSYAQVALVAIQSGQATLVADGKSLVSANDHQDLVAVAHDMTGLLQTCYHLKVIDSAPTVMSEPIN
jgi:hypothetical protein